MALNESPIGQSRFLTSHEVGTAWIVRIPDGSMSLKGSLHRADSEGAEGWWHSEAESMDQTQASQEESSPMRLSKQNLRQFCSSTSDCVQDYEICLDSQCVDLEESTGVQFWVFAAVAIGFVLLVSCVGGCLCLHPWSRYSLRNAHPRDKRLQYQKLDRKEAVKASRKFSLISDVVTRVLQLGRPDERKEERQEGVATISGAIHTKNVEGGSGESSFGDSINLSPLVKRSVKPRRDEVFTVTRASTSDSNSSTQKKRPFTLARSLTSNSIGVAAAQDAVQQLPRTGSDSTVVGRRGHSGARVVPPVSRSNATSTTILDGKSSRSSTPEIIELDFGDDHGDNDHKDVIECTKL